MANSIYEILEYRCVIAADDSTNLYVRLSNTNDFMPIKGWYWKQIPASEQSLDALFQAFGTQEYLQWQRITPDGLPCPDHQEHLARMEAMSATIRAATSRRP